ncbi:hypothetical protein BO78DRAFT_470505 [Aspergillus sclerotiicarbonarius CBS 121057]|uniref:Uncharacterized protein n=1 Tax=Aspergillus sclerotiicarbonarius (strain CBS 121057 / IBT 28362) TaxID=1448318 RepID=A0A319EV27_ASPSB|nr:hypothetical protein BO78DRAFT_470505 [Aspergillus sclerotiicarbonarius CBS 121057]
MSAAMISGLRKRTLHEPTEQWLEDEHYKPLTFAEPRPSTGDIHGPRINRTMPLSLSQFRTMMSGTGLKKRRWLRTLRYTIAVPHRIEDWKALEGRFYWGGHMERLRNDEQFGKAIADLFETLSTWSEHHRLSLEINVIGYKTYLEPHTEWAADAGEYTWIMRLGREFAIPPYRARFLYDDASRLANVPCIDRIIFANKDDLKGITRTRHQTWVGTMFQIIEHCPTIREAQLDLEEFIRPDHEYLMRDRRQALAEGLPKLLRTLKKLVYANQIERNWITPMPAINVLSSETDTLSNNLRDLTFSLRELKLKQTALSLDWLFPLNENCEPVPNTTEYYWPHLETISLYEVPEFLPSGEYLFHYHPAMEPEYAEIEDWDDAICQTNPIGIVEKTWPGRSLIDHEAFHRLYISMGHAAQRMPQLRQMGHVLVADEKGNSEDDWQNNFTCLRLKSTGNLAVCWDSEAGYRPDKRVAAAWGFESQ